MQKMDFIPLLKKRFQAPLPGRAAQSKMAFAGRGNYNVIIPKDVKIACVLCLLYPRNEDWHIVLIERVAAENDRHSGQIGFPGGKYEPADGTYLNGALREAEEEVGIKPQDVTIIGKMTPLYIPVSNFHVYPFVGALDYTPIFIPEEKEVQEVVEVPLDLLIAKETRQQKTLILRNKYVLKNVPYFNVKNKTIWGATAMMLSEFIEILPQ